MNIHHIQICNTRLHSAYENKTLLKSDPYYLKLIKCIGMEQMCASYFNEIDENKGRNQIMDQIATDKSYFKKSRVPSKFVCTTKNVYMKFTKIMIRHLEDQMCVLS